jgi:hypothetical protein
VADACQKQHPSSVSGREVRGLSPSGGADPQEKSRVCPDTGDDHEAKVCLQSVPGPLHGYRELPLPLHSLQKEDYDARSIKKNNSELVE